MTHVLAYFRQSDEEGHKKDLSIPAQEARFAADVARAQEAGASFTWEIAPADEGQSGGDMNRPGLQWILSRLDSLALGDRVWVYDHDRFVRHRVYGPILMEELRKRGITLWVSTGGSDEPTPMGRFVTDIRMRFGALYREMVADKTKENTRQRLRDGYWSNHAPTGYRFVDENGPGSKRILVPDPVAGPQIRRLFDLLAEGVSQREACTVTGTYASKVFWQRSNPLYLGLVYDRHENLEALPDLSYGTLTRLADDQDVEWMWRGRHEPLVTPEIWDAVQRRRRSRVTRYGLSGAIICRRCERKVWIHQKDAVRAPRVRCRCGWEKSYRYVERTILDALDALLTREEFTIALDEALRRDASPAESPALVAMREERTQIEQRLQRALDALLDAPELADTLRRRVFDLQEQKRAVDAALTRLIAQEGRRPDLVEWRRMRQALSERPIGAWWQVATPAEQRAVLGDVFTGIMADADGMTFRVEDLELEFSLPYVGGDEVAGPGFEPGTP